MATRQWLFEVCWHRMILKIQAWKLLGCERLAGNNRVGAERGIAPRLPTMGLATTEPGGGFEPQTILVGQSNEGQRGTHGERSDPGDPVEGRLGRRVQNFQVLEVAEAQSLVDRNRGRRQFKSSETGSAPGLGKPVTNLENQRANKRRS